MASQYSAGLTRYRDSFADLTTGERVCCDDLIIELKEANGTNGPLTDRDRQILWHCVFLSWNTRRLAHHPGLIRPRTLEEELLEVGTWNSDLPVETGNRIPLLLRMIWAAKLTRVLRRKRLAYSDQPASQGGCKSVLKAFHRKR
jgi:hypothetical protein